MPKGRMFYSGIVDFSQKISYNPLFNFYYRKNTVMHYRRKKYSQIFLLFICIANFKTYLWFGIITIVNLMNLGAWNDIFKLYLT